MSLSPPSVEPVYGSMLVLFLSAGSYSDKFLSDVLLAFFLDPYHVWVGTLVWASPT